MSAVNCKACHISRWFDEMTLGYCQKCRAMTTEEKLQAIYEAGFEFRIANHRKRNGEKYLDVNYDFYGWLRDREREGEDLWREWKPCKTIAEAVNWLYENTVGKK